MGTSKDTSIRTVKRRRLTGLHVGEGYTPHPFDLQCGVRTSGLIAGRNLKSGSRNDRHITAYYGVAPSVFQEMLALWRRTRPAAELDQYSFVDLGAGMGRAMLLASEHPFRSVEGVEMHPTLARIARKNMALWRAAGRALAPMHMHCKDAVAYKLPKGPCVLFLFNPFGAPVLKRLLNRWTKEFQGREGQIDLLYVNHEQINTIRCQSGWTRLFSGEVRRSHADLAADRKILNAQPEGEYASPPWEDCSIFRWTGIPARKHS